MGGGAYSFVACFSHFDHRPRLPFETGEGSLQCPIQITPEHTIPSGWLIRLKRGIEHPYQVRSRAAYFYHVDLEQHLTK